MPNEILETIQEQIEALQKQAQEIKAKEFTSALTKTQTLINNYGIQVSDLRFPRVTENRSNSEAKDKKVTQKAPIKYRGPNGETWTGRGLKPRWITTLMDSGTALESLLVA